MKKYLLILDLSDEQKQFEFAERVDAEIALQQAKNEAEELGLVLEYRIQEIAIEDQAA